MISSIEKYDQELEQDISSLEKHIDEDEELAKMDFQNLGCPKEIAEQIARKEKEKGKHMHPSFGFTSIGMDEALKLLKELTESLQVLPSRVYLNCPDMVWESDLLSIQIIREDGSFRFNTTTLSDQERTKFVEYMHTLFEVYHNWLYWGIYHCYPSPELVRFVAEMLIKYKEEQLLSKEPVKDNKAWKLWGKIVGMK